MAGLPIRTQVGRIHTIWLCIALCFLAEANMSGQGRPSRSRLSTAEVAKQVSPSVVTIESSSGQGSGVLLDASGVVVTNLHVVRGNTEVSVKLANGDIYDDVMVVDVDERKDLLLLKIKAVELPSVAIGNSDQVIVGEKVVLIGSPKGLDLTVSDGVISALRDSGEGYRLFQTTAAASPGSSGGGMFNEYGQLIGIVSAKLRTGENINFAIPANYVRGLLSTQSRMTLTELAQRFPAQPDAQAGASKEGNSPVARDQNVAATDLARILASASVKHEKRGENSWVIPYNGKHLSDLEVHLSAYKGLVVAQTIVAKAPSLSPEQMSRLLELNFTSDLGKVSIQDKNVIAVNEMESRLLDVAALEQMADSVASIADDAAGVLALTTVAELPPLRLTIKNNADSLSVLQGRGTLWYEPAEWKRERTGEAGVAQFANRNGYVYGRIITESVVIPLADLENVAIANAQSVDPNAKIVSRSVRMVNGVRMSVLRIDATIEKTPIVFIGHYYSDRSGTLQIIGWSSRALIESARPVIDSLVSGFQLRN